MTTQNTETTTSEPTPTTNSKDERTWAMFCHLSSFCGYFFPLGNIIAPFIIWQIKKDEFALVDDQGKEALNFQISMSIYIIGSIILIFVLVGLPILLGLLFFDFVVTIIAAIKANDGVKYRYPMSIKFVN